MIENKLEELTSALAMNTAALKAHTAALNGGAKEAGTTDAKPKVSTKSEAKAETKPKADAKPAAKAKATISLEKIRVAFETFLGVDDEDEYSARRAMIKEFAASHGAAKATEIPESEYENALKWIEEATAEREAASEKEDAI